MTTAFRTIGFTAILFAGLSATAPAFAGTGMLQTPAAAPDARAEIGRQICVRMELSNSRVRQRVCRTQAEWERRGGVPTE